MDSSLSKPEILDLFTLLKKGYSLKELVLKGFRLKIASKIISHLKYSFYSRGKGVEIDSRSVIDGSKYIAIKNNVWLQRGAWLAVPLIDIKNIEKRPYLVIEEGVRIGANCTISAGNKITIKKNVLFGPNVMLLDHYHRYEDIDKPVSHQGICAEGELEIGENSWIGTNSVVFSARKKLTIGRNSVIAANSVVRNSVPDYTVVSGNPAVPIKKYCKNLNKWIKVDS